MGRQLYGVAPTDPVAFGVAITVGAAIALQAAWLPARRLREVDLSQVVRDALV